MPRLVCLTHLSRVDSSTLTLWAGPFPVKGVSSKFLLLPWFTEIPVRNANSVDPDQTPRSAASDLGLHCLPMSILWDARRNYKWVKLVAHAILWEILCPAQMENEKEGETHHLKLG